MTKKTRFKRAVSINIDMSKKRPEISIWGIVLVILGIIMYSQQSGLGLLIVIIGILKLFWDILKYA
ncbi:hypothetical protein J4217_03585 [Candidatus Pacearchaeota archaeon]|nr:hypothetical protein [Candidatus Pacearchaeota archaeon]